MDLPVGSIIMWYRSTADIPAGWIVCDGNDGTPDLRGRYVVGIDSDVERIPTGNATHKHTNQNTVAAGDHVHDITGSIAGTVTSVGVSYVGSGASGISPTHEHSITEAGMDLPASDSHQHTTSDTADAINAPPYVQVHFIMRKL